MKKRLKFIKLSIMVVLLAGMISACASASHCEGHHPQSGKKLHKNYNPN